MSADASDSIDWGETSKMQAHPESPVAPLCEDLEDESLVSGDRCYSTCQGQCPQNVLQTGLVFDFDEVRPGHPGCVSHFECVGNYDRVLCHALDNVKAASMKGLLLPMAAWWLAGVAEQKDRRRPPDRVQKKNAPGAAVLPQPKENIFRGAGGSHGGRKSLEAPAERKQMLEKPHVESFL
eukprot:CAMPEP_0178992282 /NCGR_PEP_ID=MMETSP0795-20121207/6020_1 /TAXON_ID=88552 /ORGANISM="Amoebophrya sp., Strain Ameob2" /LENGTH=179 /DNA_ID=CAMNT_0020684131 /DNA_START=89 /DNA_END=628 /DNA_ORIENTATION=-